MSEKINIFDNDEESDPVGLIIMGITYGMFGTINPTEEQIKEVTMKAEKFFEECIIPEIDKYKEPLEDDKKENTSGLILGVRAQD